jgi:hypothetical protein
VIDDGFRVLAERRVTRGRRAQKGESRGKARIWWLVARTKQRDKWSEKRDRGHNRCKLSSAQKSQAGMRRAAKIKCALKLSVLLWGDLEWGVRVQLLRQRKDELLEAWLESDS